MIRFVMFLFLLSAFTVHAAGLVSYPSLDGDIEKCSAVNSLGALQQHAYGNALNFLCRTSIVRRVEREQLDQ